MNFPGFVSFTLERLEENGFSAYLVGGCVRDFLMGSIPADYDITTDASPGQIEKCFADIKTLDIGKKHGTITLVFDEANVEVTTYRVDGEYHDSRHPESVTFTDRIEDDLKRRDYTMNAIAYSPKRGFVDPFCGREDIIRGVIRCVGDPSLRFREDALRIMRGLRFASRLGFEIENETCLAIHDNRQLLLKVAMERICSEFCGIIREMNCAEVISEYFDVFSLIFPVVSKIDFCALKRASGLCKDAAVCVFFSCVKDMGVLTSELKRLKFDNNSVKKIVSVLMLVQKYYDKCRDADIKKAACEIGCENTITLYRVLYSLTGDEKYTDASIRTAALESSGGLINLKKLAVKGNEIIEKYNIVPSLTGEILTKLLEDVIEEIIPNEKACLIERAKKYI